MSLRDAVLREPKTKDIEAFGKTVTVSEINAYDRLDYFNYIRRLQDSGESDERLGVRMSAFLMVKSAVENGERVFADDEVEAIADTIRDMDGLNAVYRASAELNALIVSEEGN